MLSGFTKKAENCYLLTGYSFVLKTAYVCLTLQLSEVIA